MDYKVDFRVNVEHCPKLNGFLVVFGVYWVEDQDLKYQSHWSVGPFNSSSSSNGSPLLNSLLHSRYCCYQIFDHLFDKIFENLKNSKKQKKSKKYIF